MMRRNVWERSYRTDKQYLKLSKTLSGYIEIDHFGNSDLHKDVSAITAHILSRIIIAP
ncbi:MAG TPA: hypothetical protein VNI77_03210 [Nitrososphaera sp.]|nr:hypothetical protein [Nitrososphaera sp.]